MFLPPVSCSSDSTVSIFENAKDSRSTFKFNSFRFQRLEKVSTVWLHCEVQVCDAERLVCQPVRTLTKLGRQKPALESADAFTAN